jgi:uncharacterized membrane protein YfcA
MFAPDSPLIVIAAMRGAITAVSGFGLGSILTPLFMVSFPAPLAVAMAAIPHAVGNLLRGWQLRREIDGRTFRQFGIASALGAIAGAILQPTLGDRALKLVLAILLLLAGTSELLRRRIPIPPTPFWRLAGGALSGLSGGLVGNQGGIRSAVLLGFQLPPLALVATATASALCVDLARLPIYFVHSGPALLAHAPLVLAATAGSLLGTLIGVPVLGRIPEPRYRRIVGGLLVLLGLSLVITASQSGTH